MTREEVAEIMNYCKEYKVTYKSRLEELNIPVWRVFMTANQVIPCMYDDVCYKSNYQTIDTQFDMAPTTVLKKTIIPYQQYGIVYMFQQNKIYSFSSNGSILSINNLSNH